MDSNMITASKESNRLGWRTLVLVTAGYLVMLAAATFPVVTRLGDQIPGGISDPCMHLWIMRWYEYCLEQGKAPFFCDKVNYPVGVALGQDPPLHLQTLLFLLLRVFTESEELRFGLIWMTGFLMTGVATFWLAWSVLRDRWAAWLAGLMTMLSGPMLLHAHGHLELVFVGGFPIFLWAWLRWMERPGIWRMLTAAGAYLLLAMCAPYFGVMAVFPAALVLTFHAFENGWRGALSWMRSRWVGLAVYGAICLAGMTVLFVNHLWAMTHGVPMERSADQFHFFKVPWWGYFVPIPYLRLAPWLGSSLYNDPRVGGIVVEVGSYLGLLTLLMLAIGCARGTGIPRKGLWWSMLLMLVVLSFGSSWKVGEWVIPLPAGWLREHFPLMKSTRVPARFNLFAMVVASIIAAGVVKQGLQRLRAPWGRGIVVAALSGVVLFDLGHTPFPTTSLPACPPAYGKLLAMDPEATFLEVPQYDPFGGTEAAELNSVLSYWQSKHGGKTTAGYTAIPNPAFEHTVNQTSPFLDRHVRQAQYAVEPSLAAADLSRDVPLLDTAWLFLHVYDIDYLVIHDWFGEFIPTYQAPLAQLRDLLSGAEAIKDDKISIYRRDALPKPDQPVLLPTIGWSERRLVFGSINAGIADKGRLAVYVPDGTPAVRLAIEARGRAKPQRVRLMAGAGALPLAEWTIEPGRFGSYVSEPFTLPAGRHELTLEVAEPLLTPAHDDPYVYPVRVSALVFKAVEDQPSKPLPIARTKNSTERQ